MAGKKKRNGHGSGVAPEVKPEESKAPDPDRVPTQALKDAFVASLEKEQTAKARVKAIGEDDPSLGRITERAVAVGDAAMATAERMIAASALAQRYCETYKDETPIALVNGTEYRCMRPKDGNVYRLTAPGKREVRPDPE